MRPHPIHRLFNPLASLLCAGAVLLLAHPALASVRASFVEVATWETGYQAAYLITNDGPGAVTAWTVEFDLPATNTISSSWDSALARNAQHLVFKNAAWNGELAVGASTSFGFVVVGTTRPANCTINGGPCDTLPPLASATTRDVRPIRLADQARSCAIDGAGASRLLDAMRAARRPLRRSRGARLRIPRRR